MAHHNQSTDPTEGRDVPSDYGDLLAEMSAPLTSVNLQSSEQHVYHHSEAREPYGNLTMGKSAKGDRTFTIEIKNVTAETLDAAMALRIELHLEAIAPDPEPVVETSGAEVLIELGDLVDESDITDRDYREEDAEPVIF